jgi:uncharacterized membrane protein
MDAKQVTEQAASVPTTLPFRAVLTPHRSLSKPGFLIVMGVLGAVSFAAGIAFTMIGAWPVFGFFGLDVLLVYVAFKLNYRAARATETIEVTRDDLKITHTAASGRTRRITTMNPTWSRVDAREAPDGSVDLFLTSRARSIPVARCLGSDQRRDFAVALRAALKLVREPIWPR